MFFLSRAGNIEGLAFYQAGAGTPVLLLHGVGLRAECWISQIRILRRTCEVFAVDLPGHGESQNPSGEKATLEDYSLRIGEFIKNVVRRPAVVVGHSVGALMALDVAFRFPRWCTGVAALNAVYRRPSSAKNAVLSRAKMLQNGDDIVDATIARWFGEKPAGRAQRAAFFCRKWLSSVDRLEYASLYRVFAEEDGPADNALSRLDVPALFLTGVDDINSVPSMSHAMAAQAPHGRAVIVNGGHLTQMSHAREVNHALSAFVCECAATGQQAAAGGK